jgi:hypothetical protein
MRNEFGTNKEGKKSGARQPLAERDWVSFGAGAGAVFFSIATILLGILYFRDFIPESEGVPSAGKTAATDDETFTNYSAAESQDETASSKPTPIPTIVGENYTITTTENGWQDYQNLRFHFSVSLPPDWVVLDMSADEIEVQLTEGIQNYPELETIAKNNALQLSTEELKLFAMEVDFDILPDIKSFANINVMVTEIPASLTFDEVAAGNIDALKTIFGEDVNITQREVLIGDLETFMFEYETEWDDTSGQPFHLLTRHYIVVRNQKQYMFTFTDKDELTDYRPLFDLIAASIRVTDQ